MHGDWLDDCSVELDPYCLDAQLRVGYCHISRTGKFRSESEDEPQYVAIQEGGSSQPTLVQIDPKTQTTVVYQIETGSVKMSCGETRSLETG